MATLEGPLTIRELLDQYKALSDRLHCPNCGLGFTLGSDYAEHMRCYVPTPNTETKPESKSEESD